MKVKLLVMFKMKISKSKQKIFINLNSYNTMIIIYLRIILNFIILTKKILVIGNEGNGISKIIKDNSDFIVSIPMYGKINSLNASVAAGIVIYEAVKGRNEL